MALLLIHVNHNNLSGDEKRIEWKIRKLYNVKVESKFHNN